ncbi:hypothetical protein BXP28_22050 [Paenibacillus larvae subsp. larvae]|nr:hypothetical protein BXP28_22050 [Paenibacillus larvae subsp. larvae]
MVAIEGYDAIHFPCQRPSRIDTAQGSPDLAEHQPCSLVGYPNYQTERASISSMTTAVQENITGVRTVKSFAREPHEVDKFKLCNENYKETNIHTPKIWANIFRLWN